MWVWTLNWSRITHELILGSCPMCEDDIERIRSATGITAMLSVQHDECLRQFSIDYPAFVRHGKRLGLVMRRCPIRDFDPPDMRRNLPTAVRMLAGLMASGHRVYVHCTAGIGRGALVILGYLVFIEGRAPEEAAELIRRCRACVAPNWEAFTAAGMIWWSSTGGALRSAPGNSTNCAAACIAQGRRRKTGIGRNAKSFGLHCSRRMCRVASREHFPISVIPADKRALQLRRQAGALLARVRHCGGRTVFFASSKFFRPGGYTDHSGAITSICSGRARVTALRTASGFVAFRRVGADPACHCSVTAEETWKSSTGWCGKWSPR